MTAPLPNQTPFVADEDVVDAIVLSLQRSGSARVVLWGRSMVPTIWPGSSVDVELCDRHAIRKGDVALVRRGHTLSAHRVVADGPDGWVCQGDFNFSPDPPVKGGELLGRVTSFHVGPVAIRTPGLARALGLATVSVSPVSRIVIRAASRHARFLVRRAMRQPLIVALRARLQSFSVDLVRREHLAALRSARLRRGGRPTRDHLKAWLRYVQDSERLTLPTAVVAVGPRQRVIGHLRVHHASAQRVGLYDLWVEPAYRTLGVATALVVAAVERLDTAAAELGVWTAECDVRRERGPAYRAFAAAGFIEDDRVLPATQDHIRLIRSLGKP